MPTSELEHDNYPSLPKPKSLLSLYDLTEEVFGILKKIRARDTYVLNLAHVDSAKRVISNVDDITAMTLRKVQALRFAATKGTKVANYLVVGYCAMLHTDLEELAKHLPLDDRDRLLDLRDVISETGRRIAQVRIQDEWSPVIIFV